MQSIFACWWGLVGSPPGAPRPWLSMLEPLPQSLHGPQLVLSFVCLLSGAGMGLSPPGSLGVGCWWQDHTKWGCGKVLRGTKLFLLQQLGHHQWDSCLAQACLLQMTLFVLGGHWGFSLLTGPQRLYRGPFVGGGCQIIVVGWIQVRDILFSHLADVTLNFYFNKKRFFVASHTKWSYGHK